MTTSHPIADALERHATRPPLSTREADELIVELAADILSDTSDMLAFASGIKRIAAAKDLEPAAVATLVRSAAGLAA